ncbi:ABC transporter permease [Jiangella muralis]|uniref:ABC transporter permease n=1 Tax=Jiangella muralis TaxID=702383 RepID=UPI0009F8BADF|nr:ABC transporter permease [Jiangella muralis]
MTATLDRAAGPAGAGPKRTATRRRPPVMRFIARRALSTSFLLVGVTAAVFAVSRFVPTDPVVANLGTEAAQDPAIVEAYREKHGLDQPLPVQYLTYLWRLLHGDLGQSIQTGQAVSADLAARVPATVELALAAMIIALLVSIPLGTVAALRRGKPSDKAVLGGTLLGMSAPSFWVGLVALYLFFFRLGWVPGGGRLSLEYVPPPSRTHLYTVDALISGDVALAMDAARHLVLPAAVLALPMIALLTRFVRSSILDVLGEDYVRNARAKGLGEPTVIVRYVLRAAAPQILTVVGLALANAFVGTLLVEQVFSWPGMGSYAYQSAIRLDFPAVMGVCLVITVAYIIINLSVDLLYGVVDPRMRVTT